MKKITLLFVISALLFSCSACSDKKGKKDAVWVTFVLGKADLIRQGAPARPVKAQEFLLNGDLIQTAEKSYVTLQINQDIVLAINPKTQFVLDKAEDLTAKEFQLNQGEVLSKLSKLTQGKMFTVKTPLISAGVRGTEFLTCHNPQRSSVSVGSGQVLVSPMNNKAELILVKGNAADYQPEKDKLEKRNISREEMLKLEFLNKLPAVENFQQLSKQQQEELAQKIGKLITEQESLLESIPQTENNKTSAQLLSLEELKLKYGKIDIIKLYNGREIKGIILSRKPDMQVLTPTGAITLKVKDIQSTQILQ